MGRVLLTIGLLMAVLISSAVAATRLGFEDLVANLKSPNARTRQEAAAALGKIHRREAVTPLAALVHDPDARVRLEVVHALREIRDMGAVPALVAAVSDADPRPRAEAIDALVDLYVQKERPSVVGRLVEALSEDAEPSVPSYVKIDSSVEKALIGALRDEDRGVREQASTAIGVLHATSAAKPLIAALQDSEPAVRAAATAALGRVGKPEDGKALIPLIADESATVRVRVLESIAALRVRQAGPPLRELYEANRRRESATKILAALSRIADPNQADLFRELLQDPDPEKKRLAIEGLARISDASLLFAFKKDYQRERNDEVRLAYNFALTLLGDHAFVDTIVLDLPSRLLAARARAYILELGPGILPELYPYLNDPDAAVRAELCDILGALGDSETVTRLTPLLNDPSTTVADRANRAIERLRRTSSAASAS